MAELSALAAPKRPLTKSEQPSWVANSVQDYWRSGGVLDDPRCLPSPYNAVHHSPRIEELFPMPKRQFVGIADRQDARYILRTDRPLVARSVLIRIGAARRTKKGNR